MRRRVRRAGGFTLFELILVVCLVGLFATVALERLLRYQELAEKTAMERTVNVLRSALAMRLAARVARGGGLAEALGLAGENPMDWLAERPSNYLGALFGPVADEIARGSWYYDRQARELVYRVHLTRFLDPGPAGSDQIRFRVVVRLGGEDDAEPGEQKELQELTIRPTRPYAWNP